MSEAAIWTKSPARILMCALAMVGLALPACADGIDISVWFTRVFARTSGTMTAVVILGLMLVNCATNLLVVVLPAVRSGPVKMKEALHDLAGFTLFGQVADRLGAVLAVILSLPLLYFEDKWNLFPGDPGDEVPGMTSLVVTLASVGALCSGVVVGLLAFHYAHRRWKVERRPALRIAIAAGVLTNPMLWALAAGFGIQASK